jgi:hypothetical protein
MVTTRHAGAGAAGAERSELGAPAGREPGSAEPPVGVDGAGGWGDADAAAEAVGAAPTLATAAAGDAAAGDAAAGDAPIVAGSDAWQANAISATAARAHPNRAE